jgi:hypothetical protein
MMGRYVFADYCSGRICSASLDAAGATGLSLER